jgi:hypothetical protein
MDGNIRRQTSIYEYWWRRRTCDKYGWNILRRYQYGVNIYLLVLTAGELHIRSQRKRASCRKCSIRDCESTRSWIRHPIDENSEILATCTSSTRVTDSITYPNSPRYNTRVNTQVRIHWIEYYAVYYHGRERPLVHKYIRYRVVYNLYTTRARDEADDITSIGPKPVIINLLHH